jgi:hypothetical protein
MLFVFICLNLFTFFMCSTMNVCNESKNSLPVGCMLNFLNSYLQETYSVLMLSIIIMICFLLSAFFRRQ